MAKCKTKTQGILNQMEEVPVYNLNILREDDLINFFKVIFDVKTNKQPIKQNRNGKENNAVSKTC
jgi:hypothetical protein